MYSPSSFRSVCLSAFLSFCWSNIRLPSVKVNYLFSYFFMSLFVALVLSFGTCMSFFLYVRNLLKPRECVHVRFMWGATTEICISHRSIHQDKTRLDLKRSANDHGNACFAADASTLVALPHVWGRWFLAVQKHGWNR